MSINIQHFENINSTNDYAIDLIRNTDHKIDDTAILADTQSSGRGRLNGKTWLSVNGNFHCTYIINIANLNIQINKTPLITNAVIYSVKELLNSIIGNDDRIKVKLPNDILISSTGNEEEKKVAGVLVEVLPPYAVIGVGINISKSPLTTATNIKDEFDVIIDKRNFAEKLYTSLINGIQSELE
jgi:biotin-[acetyl-CoA-carboxylase] ligase BirA-like protein